MNTAFAEMFRYNRWANDTLLEACRTLTDEHLDAHMPGISGTVRVLLMHMVGGQQTFVLRTKGRQHEGELTRGSQWPGWDRLLAIASETNDALVAIAEGIDAEATVDLPYQGKTFRFPQVFFLVHAMEHAAEHRTEIKVALLQVGIDTPDLDAWSYAAFAGYGGEV